MKILHCSDIHLGRRPVGGIGEFSNKRFDDYFAAFDWAIDLALREHVDVVMITGDLFDRKELVPEVLERTEKLLQRLVKAQIRILLVEGNHDNIAWGKETDSWIIYLENKGLLKRLTFTFDETGYHFDPLIIDGIAFYGLGYPGGLVNETMQALAAQLSDDARNIIMVHTAISGGDLLPGTIERVTIDLLKDLVLYIAGGHLHSFQVYPRDNPFFFIPGSLEYWDLAEESNRKGVIIFDTNTKEYVFYPSQPRQKLVFELNAQSQNAADFKREFEIFVDGCVSLQDAIVVVDVKLATSFYIDTAWCESELQKKGALRSIVRLHYPGDIEDRLTQLSHSGIEDAERELIVAWGDVFSQRANDVSKILNMLKTYQNENAGNLFFEQFDRMIDAVHQGDVDESN